VNECQERPPRPDCIADKLRAGSEEYSRFLFYIARRVEGKRNFDNDVARKKLTDMLHVGKEAFILLVYENGYERWSSVSTNGTMGVDVSSSSDATSESEETNARPGYKYTQGVNVTAMTRRNQGWSRQGCDRFAELYRKIKEDRQVNSTVFNREFKDWLKDKVDLSGRPAKRKRTVPQSTPQMPDDLGEMEAV
jgi:hypothetical protein